MNERIGPAAPSGLPRLAVGALERIGFWGTILLPAAYIPVLYSLDGREQLITVVALVGVNVLCLLVGQQYGT